MRKRNVLKSLDVYSLPARAPPFIDFIFSKRYLSGAFRRSVDFAYRNSAVKKKKKTPSYFLFSFRNIFYSYRPAVPGAIYFLYIKHFRRVKRRVCCSCRSNSGGVVPDEERKIVFVFFLFTTLRDGNTLFMRVFTTWCCTASCLAHVHTKIFLDLNFRFSSARAPTRTAARVENQKDRKKKKTIFI